MGLLRSSAKRGGPDPHLHWKIAAFVIGAAFGVAGMLRGSRWLLGIAIAILAIGALLRFVPHTD